jgi:drug/metabolite transporter (DMT)-like permease
MPVWVAISLIAAFAQATRFMIQKQLSVSTLSPVGATFARFLYSAPLVVVLVALYLRATDQPLPHLAPGFWAYALCGATAQIVATVCTIALFKRRNFAVGVTFTKTEVLFSVLVGFVVLSDQISVRGMAMILNGLTGVLILSKSDLNRQGGFLNVSTALGLSAGFLFAVSAVNYRGAALSLESGDFVVRGMVTLACVTTAQTLMLVGYLSWREKGEVGRVLASWRQSGLVGLTSMIGSAGWFMAFALQSAAYVKAVGQVEVLFSLAIGAIVFRERISKREAFGICLIVFSIVLLVLDSELGR